jgi:predicted metal-dependent enzyme (double-stranded beta helix superfamily)
VLTVEDLVADCRALTQGPDPAHVVAGYISQLLRETPDDVAQLLGDGNESVVLHRADDLTVVKVVMPPRYAFYPHNHLMWGAVGTVVGREDNTFFVRDGARLERTTGAAYEQGQVGVLHESVIHAVHNPSRAHTVGLHVYGGDLVAAPASEWDPETFHEHPYDADVAAARRAAWVATLSSD